MFNLKSIILSLFLILFLVIPIVAKNSNPTICPDCDYKEYGCLSVAGFLSVALCLVFFIIFGFWGGVTACGIYLTILLFTVEHQNEDNSEVFAMKNIQYMQTYNHQTKQYDTLEDFASWEYNYDKTVPYNSIKNYINLEIETGINCVKSDDGTYYYTGKKILSYTNPKSSNYKWYYGAGGWIYNPSALIYPPLTVLLPFILVWFLITKGG